MTLSDYDPIQLEIFKHLFAAIAEEMGTVLRKTSFSPNIKERRDYSCALFDAGGLMIAQAAHIPVHLGSMPLSVLAALERFSEAEALQPGDMVILNDPFRGGTHLPDITLVSPVFDESQALLGFVASRAHHADVGGMTPGSMPVSREIFQEGLIIPPVRLVRAGKVNQETLDLLLANVRTPLERSGDLWAQIAANQRGTNRLVEMTGRYGQEHIAEAMRQLLTYTERMTRSLISSLPDGSYEFEDCLDDDGISDQPIPIRVAIRIQADSAVIDFTGSALQQAGSVNAVYAITLSAVYYVFRCLLGLDVPNNSGCLEPIQVIAPIGSVVNASRPAAVAGGNVETSQRIVDVLLGALAQACPDKIPAASQGSMNNLTIGGWDPKRRKAFTYYETIGGGMGARPGSDGPSAIHSHMTNTLNTPVEALEYAYPLQVSEYSIRSESGGAGKYRGGNGIRRSLQVLENCQVTLLSDRRRFAPYGLAGGKPGQVGRNFILRDGKELPLPGKGSLELKAGDLLVIDTPGGGGWGKG
ncbi:MAG: 5-oxoprolinase [Chloroflexi bacterium GWB2_49_20]|nr:MAG: 5-oxoprolinase [Chloroflexi bacterium GWB2_49_20]OGN79271.1 MAG: 5-oxoprolinase [Chloroflexi bacterium GWC2_49_37]OGN82959.1 MAG: 5-oxoprolinase [Chloroflexi bacterium GWD2_49_16]HCC78614.1 5-oxoprolinase [Anaerolineae bacterium]